MFSFKSIVMIAGALAITDASGIAAVAAPLVAPAQVGYAHAVPQNIPPYASQISYFNRGLSPLIAGPVAAPFAAPFAAPLAAPVGPSPYFVGGPAPYVAAPAFAAGPIAAGPFLGGPSPYTLPGPAPFAGPVPFAAAPLLRSPYGYAPAFVR